MRFQALGKHWEMKVTCRQGLLAPSGLALSAVVLASPWLLWVAPPHS